VRRRRSAERQRHVGERESVAAADLDSHGGAGQDRIGAPVSRDQRWAANYDSCAHNLDTAVCYDDMVRVEIPVGLRVGGRIRTHHGERRRELSLAAWLPLQGPGATDQILAGGSRRVRREVIDQTFDFGGGWGGSFLAEQTCRS